MGIVVGLSSVPAAAQALQVVEWEVAPPEDAAAGWTVVPVGADMALRPAAEAGSAAQAPPASAALPRRVPIPQSEAPLQAGHDQGSALLAGLGAVVLLMWRRLRRH